MSVAEDFPDPPADLQRPGPQSLVLGGGCFWCTEAVFLAVDGVTAVTPGYAGGSADTAHYEAVCSGRTGHAEVIRINYDGNRTSIGQLLKIFFAVAHDPTQLNRQGNDRGSQYRSVIFYRDEEQAALARDYIALLDRSGRFAAPVVTTLEPLQAFYPAEAEHHDYAARHPLQPYILFAARPKVAKLIEYFPQHLKGEKK